MRTHSHTMNMWLLLLCNLVPQCGTSVVEVHKFREKTKIAFFKSWYIEIKFVSNMAWVLNIHQVGWSINLFRITIFVYDIDNYKNRHFFVGRCFIPQSVFCPLSWNHFAEKYVFAVINSLSCPVKLSDKNIKITPSLISSSVVLVCVKEVKWFTCSF